MCLYYNLSSLKMPLAPIDEKGTSIYYEDSGVPSANPTNYTTIVIVHGLIVNGGVRYELMKRPSY